MHRADPRAGVCEHGVTIGAEHRRAGYAGEAVVMLLRHMFGERRFHKCEARVFAHNEASLAFQRRLRFVGDRRLRDHVFHGGRHHDLVLLRMLGMLGIRGVLGREFAQSQP
ncbi:GNAT family N-acetyltransferase [Streptomyces sp. NPDC056656]|uniref:GNAT family N-acetyltransferase n=1 Tax=Streptomyces sp. NPDC056656 TaxID=3345895 RepID=UPI0036C2B447